MGQLERDIEELKREEERKRIETIKAFAMSYSTRVKPFFVEFQLMEERFLGIRKTAMGMINCSLIESFHPIEPGKPEKGTQLKYVFGEHQYVAESMEEVTKKINLAIREEYT